MKLADLQALIETLKTETAAALARVAADVQALKDKLAAGDGVTEADLDGIGAGVSGVIDKLKATDPVPDEPPVA